MEKIDSTTLFPLLVESSETDFWQKRYDEEEAVSILEGLMAWMDEESEELDDVSDSDILKYVHDIVGDTPYGQLPLEIEALLRYVESV
jgi:hypothetical protein